MQGLPGRGRKQAGRHASTAASAGRSRGCQAGAHRMRMGAVQECAQFIVKRVQALTESTGRPVLSLKGNSLSRPGFMSKRW